MKLYKDPELDHKPEQLQQRGEPTIQMRLAKRLPRFMQTKIPRSWSQPKMRELFLTYRLIVLSKLPRMLGDKVPAMWLFGELPTAEKGWLQVMKAMELLTIEAAVTGDYNTALQAFTINPLVPSGETAKRVMDELFIAHKAYLPNFKSTIERLEKEGIEVQDELAKSLN